jgi:nitrogen fixation protein FixH
MQPSSAALAADQPIRKSLWIPASFVIAFLVVLGVNITLVVMAVKTFSGLETNSAYDQGLGYNTTLAEAAKNAEIGWHAGIALTPLDAASRRISVTMTDRAGTPLPDLNIKVVLVRPTNAGLDEVVILKPTEHGIYQADFKPSALGNWDLRLRAEHAGTVWQHSERIVLH